jgi:hypothetical protein
MSTDVQDIKLSELEGFEEVAATAAGRPLFHFNRVYSFRYFGRHEDELGDTWQDIELVMEELEPPHAQIGFRFHRVADVSFSGFGQIMGLYFQNIKQRGWELRYEVGDYEDGQIRLFCHSISVFAPTGGA